MINPFHQAYEIIQSKSPDQMTDDERQLLSRAIALFANELPKAFPEYDIMPISEGLKRLAEIIEGLPHWGSKNKVVNDGKSNN